MGLCITLLYSSFIQCAVVTGFDYSLCGEPKEFRPIYKMSFEENCKDNLTDITNEKSCDQ
jgi:hypothetical protein